MLYLYPGALVLFVVYLLIKDKGSKGSKGSKGTKGTTDQTQQTIDTNPTNWGKMAIFNLVIGFAGYCLRFYSINNVSTVVFSLLSFVGVISSYAFGKYFVNEEASLKTYLGAFLIASASSGIAFL